MREASKTLELDEHLERKPGNLSGGQRQRVAMGRAIVRDAEAFLFDEPLSNLDAKLRGQMRTEISRLQKRLGITTVYVTHDQTEAMTLGDRVAVLKRGLLQQLATPRELYEQPRQPVRRRLHRLAADELPAGDGRGRPASSCRSAPSRSRPRRPRRPQGKGLLIAGIRPEHFEDASVVDAATTRQGSTFRAKVDVVEWLGNEAYAYIPFEAPPEVREQLAQLERDLDGEALRTQLVVSLDGASRIAEGDEAEICVDTSKMHLFDPGTGENLTLDASHAGIVPDANAMDRRGGRARAGPGRTAASRPAELHPAGRRGDDDVARGAAPGHGRSVSGEELPASSGAAGPCG